MSPPQKVPLTGIHSEHYLVKSTSCEAGFFAKNGFLWGGAHKMCEIKIGTGNGFNKGTRFSSLVQFRYSCSVRNYSGSYIVASMEYLPIKPFCFKDVIVLLFTECLPSNIALPVKITNDGSTHCAISAKCADAIYNRRSSRDCPENIQPETSIIITPKDTR